MQLTLGHLHLNLLSAAVQDEAFSAYLNRPELTPAEQVSIFAKVLGEDQTAAVSNFLTLLAENNRLALLPEISCRIRTAQITE